jgi:hypothetical protein
LTHRVVARRRTTASANAGRTSIVLVLVLDDATSSAERPETLALALTLSLGGRFQRFGVRAVDRGFVRGIRFIPSAAAFVRGESISRRDIFSSQSVHKFSSLVFALGSRRATVSVLVQRPVRSRRALQSLANVHLSFQQLSSFRL